MVLLNGLVQGYVDDFDFHEFFTVRFQKLLESSKFMALNLPFLLNFQTNDSFSERTRGTLYSALIHSKTSDLEVKLELPELSSQYDLRCCTVHIYSILYNNTC